MKQDLMSTFERRIDQKLILSIVACGLMSFFGVVVETAMNVTFPTLMREFKVTTSTVQWITTGYLLILSVVIPLSAFLKRRFRTRTLFSVAVMLFLIGTLLCALAPWFWVLLIGRLIQGIGTGIALPLMFNIILDQAPYRSMGFMMGVGSLISAMAPAAGPFFGGMIVNSWGWRAIFWIIVPLLLIAFLVGYRSIRQVTETQRIKFHYLDSLLTALGFSLFVFATVQASDKGWLSWQVILLLVCALICLGYYGYRSWHREESLVQVRIFTRPTYLCSLFTIILVQFNTLALGFLIPNYAQLTLESNAFVAGCLLLPGCLLGALLAPTSGRILDRYGPAEPILSGVIFLLLSLVGLVITGPKNGMMMIVILYVLYALGQGLSVGNSMTNGLRHLPETLKSDGNAAINTLSLIHI